MKESHSDVPIEVMRELCEARIAYEDGPCLATTQRLDAADAAYRAAKAAAEKRLRTRAEVDAEIAAEVRAWRENCGELFKGIAMGNATAEKLNRLCAEPTRPDEPSPDRRLTEAERALCDYATSFEPGILPHDLKDARIVARVVDLFNAVRAERLGQPSKNPGQLEQLPNCRECERRRTEITGMEAEVERLSEAFNKAHDRELAAESEAAALRERVAMHDHQTDARCARFDNALALLRKMMTTIEGIPEHLRFFGQAQFLAEARALLGDKP